MTDFSGEPLLLEERVDSSPRHRGVLKKILHSRAYVGSALALNLTTVGVGSYIGVGAISEGDILPGVLAFIATGASSYTLQNIAPHINTIFGASRRGGQ